MNFGGTQNPVHNSCPDDYNVYMYMQRSMNSQDNLEEANDLESKHGLY